jgi:hypothetical protein
VASRLTASNSARRCRWPVLESSARERVPGPGQGEAGVLEGLAQTTALGPPPVPGVPTNLRECAQHPPVQVEGVGHDQGVGEQHLGRSSVAGVAVDGHHLHLCPLGVAEQGGEEQHRRGVTTGGQVDDHAPGGIGEHGGVDEVLAHAALVDGQVRSQPPTPSLVGPPALHAHRDAQVVLGDAHVPGHRPRRPAPGQVGEEPPRPLAGPAPVDALEALVEAALGAVLVLAEEPPHADRQGDDEGADHVDHVPPAAAVGPYRRPRTARAQGGGMAPGDVHDGSGTVLGGGQHLHVAAAEAQRDTVIHGSGSSLFSCRQAEVWEPGPPHWWMP